ncbi:MAG: DUF4263 domain-containing protein [Pasteurellaceae bacterium]|nr:DUF4263 domain-containing protein [Pasteurellaceae bacterium]
MKVSDFILDFKGNIKHADNGFCRVRIFTAQKKIIVILTELDNNDGQSVTNCIEHIIKYLNKMGYVCGNAIFIEHYEDYDKKDSYTPFKFDIVTLSSENTNPEWESISLNSLVNLIDDGKSFILELASNSLDNKYIFDRTTQIIQSHSTFYTKKYHQNPEYTRRYLEIEKNKKSKSEFKKLIENGVKERSDILPFLQSDLSLLGEMYAHPNDEYIVIPEFPLNDGFIDFVVFTGRSRMDVILIEVKGAEFKLLNPTGYKDFHNNIHKAAKQIRDRIDIAIYQRYDEFRKECHNIRDKIENSSFKNKHLLSPTGKLLVDPDKDICIRTVIIGGRSQNDYEESRERHKYEREHAIPIELDSWDSWISRLNRD